MPNTLSWPFGELTEDNSEFEAQVRANSSPSIHPYIDKNRAQTLNARVPVNAAGVYVTDYPKEDPTALPQVEAETGIPELFYGDVEPQPDMAYGFRQPPGFEKMFKTEGLEGKPNAGLWAHEFGHRAGFGHPATNLRQAHFAGSRRAWKKAVNSWKAITNQSFDEAEKELVKHLSSDVWQAKMAEEAASMLPADGMLKKFKNREARDKVLNPWKLWANKELLEDK